MNEIYFEKTVERYKKFCANNNREYHEPVEAFTELRYVDNLGNISPTKNDSTVDIEVLLYDSDYNVIYSLTLKDE